MGTRRSAREVFDDWARDYHAAGMEREHRPRVEELFERVPVGDGNYLEIGVGNGYGIEWMARHRFAHGRCVGLDLSPEMAELSARRVASLTNATIETADFMSWTPTPPQLRFDLIFSMEVFYYLPSIERGLERAHGLLRPGGMLIVAVNHFEEHRASHAWPDQVGTSMTLWSAARYRAAFAAAGLRDVGQELIDSAPGESGDPDDPGTLATWGVR